MRLVTQPDGSFICGQCSVAMVTDMELEEVFEKAYGGHRDWTHYIMTKQALERIGFESGNIVEVDNRRKWSLPEGKRGMIRVHVKSRNMGHMVAFNERGEVYDSHGEIFASISELTKAYTATLRRNGYKRISCVVDYYFVVTKK